MSTLERLVNDFHWLVYSVKFKMSDFHWLTDCVNFYNVKAHLELSVLTKCVDAVYLQSPN